MVGTLITQQQFDNEQLNLIRSTVAKDTTPEEFRLFVEVCKYHRLNPFARQIYAVVRKGQSGRTLTIQTSIDGFRLIAERTGKYAGQIGPEWCGPDGIWMDVWTKDEPPTAARVGVLRTGFDRPMWGIAKYKAFYVSSNPVWNKMPDHMLAIRAESIALRKAFPAEMSGIYTKEEMEQADHDLPGVTLEQSEEDKKKARLNNLFKSGRNKGLFASKEEMALYVSDALQMTITADDIASLEEEHLLAVEQSIEASDGFAEAS